MPLLFYTTSSSPERSMAEIQRLLLSAGARRISVEYAGSEREPSAAAMSFALDTPRGPQEYLLPARVERVLEVLRRQGVLRGAGRRTDTGLQRAHARSVAWRTLLEWVKLQLAMIETDQAKVDEVMLPYMLVDPVNGRGPRVTVYEQFSDKALPAPEKAARR